jgi:hypothetical protein
LPRTEGNILMTEDERSGSDPEPDRRTDPDRRTENSDRREHARYNLSDASRNDRRREDRRRGDR